MKKLSLPLLLVTAILQGLAGQPLRRPANPSKAIIVLTYDDGLTSQLQTALPQLQQAGFKATFFLTGYMGMANLPRWRAAAKAGYELGNHTVFHPCYTSNGNALPAKGYTLAAMLREISVMNTFLFALDGKTTRPFAYPCTDTLAGNQGYVEPLRQSRMASCARLGGDTDAIVTDFTRLDDFRLPAFGVDNGTPARRLIDFARLAEQSGGMGIFIFHGIGGDYLSITAGAHQQLLYYLKSHRKTIMVTTLGKALELAHQRGQALLARRQKLNPNSRQTAPVYISAKP